MTRTLLFGSVSDGSRATAEALQLNHNGTKANSNLQERGRFLSGATYAQKIKNSLH